MKKLFLLLILIPLTTLAISLDVSDKPELAVVLKENEVHISMPLEAQAALKKWNPKFSIFNRKDFTASVLQMFDEDKSQPMAFVGDIEGNGKMGLVLFGEAGKLQFVVALVQDKKDWKVIKIYSSAIPNIKSSDVASLKEVKEIGIPIYILPAEGELGKKLSPKIGIQIEAYLGSAEAYEIINGKPKQIVLQDDDFSDDFIDIK